MALWHIYGVNVVEMYGQTEDAGGIIAGQRRPFRGRAMSAPCPTAGRCGSTDDGQMLVKSPDLFEGYWKQRTRRRRSSTADGWLQTGDIGEWQDGNLRLIDRARDFLVTAGGKTISPSTSRTLCAPAPISAKRSCSVTVANISPP